MSHPAPTVEDIKEVVVDEQRTDYEVVCVCGNVHIVSSFPSRLITTYREQARTSAHRKLMAAVAKCVRARDIEAEDAAVAGNAAVSAVRDAVIALYQMPSCEVGGPLHVQVDDLNLADHFLTDHCETGWGPNSRDYFTPEVWEYAERVRVALLALSEEERRAACCAAHRVVYAIWNGA